MLNLKKLSLNTITISNLDTTKIVGGAASGTPICSSNPPTMAKLTDNKPCAPAPTMWSGCC